MYAVSTQFLNTIRRSHQAFGFVEAWHAGTRLTYRDETGQTATRLPMTDGAVTVDGSTPGVRRKLSVTLAPVPGLWDVLAPPGTELRAFTVLRYLNGREETVPQGVFDIDALTVGYTADGALQITAPDRWARIINARFLTPRTLGGAGVTARALIATLLLEALPAGTAVTDVATGTLTLPRQSEDRDRAGFIEKTATAAALDVYFDRLGAPTIRNAPTLATTGVWVIDASTNGVLVTADRERNRQKAFNMVVVNSARNTGAPPWPTQYVWDAVATSPTYAGPGAGSGTTPPAASAAGPFGQRPIFYSSPLPGTAAQAVAAGQNILNRVTGLAAQLTLTAVANPALDDGDTITVQLPPERRDLPRPLERHIIDTLTVPLVPSKTAQSIATRSTRADDPADT